MFLALLVLKLYDLITKNQFHENLIYIFLAVLFNFSQILGCFLRIEKQICLVIKRNGQYLRKLNITFRRNKKTKRKKNSSL